MATKAELEAELAKLRKQIAARDAEEVAQQAAAPPQPALADYLEQYGLDEKDIEVLWNQIATEVGNLPQKKPLLTLLGALGLGIVLGRMSHR